MQGKLRKQGKVGEEKREGVGEKGRVRNIKMEE
jgi:hypothetical protein